MDMTAPSPSAEKSCGRISDILSRIGDKWTMQVVVNLRSHPRRFNDIKRQIDGISQQMLTRTLKALERDGMVTRTVRPTTPPEVEYALTDLGHSLSGPVRQLAEWALAQMPTIEENRKVFDNR